MGAEWGFDKEQAGGEGSPEKGSASPGGRGAGGRAGGIPKSERGPAAAWSDVTCCSGQCWGATVRLPSFPEMAVGGRWDNEPTMGKVQP